AADLEPRRLRERGARLQRARETSAGRSARRRARAGVHRLISETGDSVTRVLMLGWEYPPYGTGGLAPATAGVVNGLVANGVDVVLHLPIARGIAGRRNLTVLGADASVVDLPSVY